MSVSLTNIPARYNSSSLSFGNQSKKAEKKEKKKYNNPIIPGFEYLDATKATMIAAAGFVGRVALWSCDDIDYNTIKAIGKKIPGKYPVLNFLAVASMAIGGLYFLTHLPKNLYEKKKEVFVKKNEWNVYSRTNAAEKNIYERMHQESQNADNEHKSELAKDWLKMQTARNQVPFSR
ncbi:MAG: hypothetical protein A2Y25_05240 [Candidatus Melainabacteria bacterium GWF2_37_15]|nr:MAG: hypothetical protein A2Y25_05240 [Candidatus Melainabacteria bacterium GWF2_37_15]